MRPATIVVATYVGNEHEEERERENSEETYDLADLERMTG